MERAHHLTASLYFGIAALEAFLNAEMRAKMQADKASEKEIYDTLRKGALQSKLKKWPLLLTGSRLPVRDKTVQMIEAFNELRGEITHPKETGHTLYTRLETVNPQEIIDSVAEYIVRFREAKNEQYPYWVFGWNYLNPRTASYEIILIHNQQFCYSLQGLGFSAEPSQVWQDTILKGYVRYGEVKKALESISHCEPKSIFPFQPKLCRRWWEADHQRSCGNVTQQAIEEARNLGKRPRGT